MIEVITKVLQHNPDGTFRELAMSGAVQFPESKINNPSIHDRCKKTMTNLLKSVAGYPELDDDILTDNISAESAKLILQQMARGEMILYKAVVQNDTIHLTIRRME